MILCPRLTGIKSIIFSNVYEILNIYIYTIRRFTLASLGYSSHTTPSRGDTEKYPTYFPLFHLIFIDISLYPQGITRRV